MGGAAAMRGDAATAGGAKTAVGLGGAFSPDALGNAGGRGNGCSSGSPGSVGGADMLANAPRSISDVLALAAAAGSPATDSGVAEGGGSGAPSCSLSSAAIA
jgi:hypothetical protein